jgi:RimJ/RimL family protein N-acetyltransferase
VDRIDPASPLITPRLILRGLQPDDAAFVLALLNEPSFIAHVGDRGVRTLAEAERYVAAGPWTRDLAAGFGLRVVERRDTAQAIGICGLLKRETFDAPDLGFAFLPAHWSKGYAFEAATATLDYARAVLGHAIVLAITRPSNRPSIRLLERIGMRRERLTRIAEGAEEVAVYTTASDRMPQP